MRFPWRVFFPLFVGRVFIRKTVLCIWEGSSRAPPLLLDLKNSALFTIRNSWEGEHWPVGIIRRSLTPLCGSELQVSYRHITPVILYKGLKGRRWNNKYASKRHHWNCHATDRWSRSCYIRGWLSHQSKLHGLLVWGTFLSCLTLWRHHASAKCAFPVCALMMWR